MMMLILLLMVSMVQFISCSTNITTTVNDNHIESTLYHTDGQSENENDKQNLPDIVPSVSQQQPSIPQQNNKTPTLPVCPPIPVIPHALPNVQNPNISVVAGTTVTYSCENGYTRTQGSYEIKCITSTFYFPSAFISSSTYSPRAKWENSTLVCQIIRCPDPGFVENAVRVSNGFNYASNISYSCNKGYVMSGAPFIHCTRNGVWNRQRPKCDPVTCPKLENPGNGTIIYSDDRRSFKSLATVSCFPKFHPDRNVSLYCRDDGKWNQSLPSCVKNICPRLIPEHSGILVFGPKKRPEVGSVAIMKCHDGNSRTVRCKDDGTWDKQDFNCAHPGEKFCPVITPLENGRHNGTSKVTGYSDGIVISFFCNQDYYRDGPPWIRCRHGTWTSSKPRCVLHEYGSLSRSPSSSNQLTVLGTVLFVILFFILTVLSIILHRLRQRHLEKQYWKRYFGNHTYRQSRTNITATCNQEMRFFCQSRSTVPVTDL